MYILSDSTMLLFTYITLARCVFTIIPSIVGLTAVLPSTVAESSFAGSSFAGQFTRAAVQYSPLRTYIGVSLARCRQECGRRGVCQGVIYSRVTTQCGLVTRVKSDVTREAGRGKVLVTGINPSGYLICDGMQCRGQCIQEGDVAVCKKPECEPPPRRFTTMSGNMFSVGNKLLLTAGDAETHITCMEDGAWQSDTPGISRDCTDITGVTGQYILQPSLQGVYCDMDTDGGQWLVFQRRQDGSENFMRGWDDYVNGFGSLDGEFWLGLGSIYRILSTGQFEMRVDLEKFSGERGFAKYSTFTLSGPSDNFRLGIAGYSGDAGDAFGAYHDGMMFTTYDADNDNDPRNCAETYRGAWWYNWCHWSNLNGLYFNSGQQTSVHAIHVHWGGWTGTSLSLKRTEMKLRRSGIETRLVQ